MIQRGDRVETIYKDFIRKDDIGLTGEIIDLEKYENHWSCVDSRGEDCGVSFIDVIFKMDNGATRRVQNIYVVKTNKN
jgi:hypothetical protein